MVKKIYTLVTHPIMSVNVKSFITLSTELTKLRRF